MTFEFYAEIWEWRGVGSWHFVSLPSEASDEIEDARGPRTSGFGAVPVIVTIGSTTWTTSIFPSKEEETYVLPVKKPVRTAEGLQAGDVARVTLSLRL